jgi:hypothetical protein
MQPDPLDLNEMNPSLPWSALRFSNGVSTRNRLLLAPMTNQQSRDDGVISGTELEWLRMRAEGGFGILVSAASHVREDAKASTASWAASAIGTSPGWPGLRRWGVPLRPCPSFSCSMAVFAHRAG